MNLPGGANAKHFRWTQNGTHTAARQGPVLGLKLSKSGMTWRTSSRARAEQAGEREGLQDCIDLFIQDKKVQGITEDRLGRYTRELDRLRQYCERSGVYTIQGITRELLTAFVGRGRPFLGWCPSALPPDKE